MNPSGTSSCIKQNLFLQMEAEREGLQHILREDYIPVFVANLLRDRLCPNNDESTLGKSAFQLAIKGGENIKGESSEQWTDDSFMEEYTDFENSFLISEQSLEFVHQVLKFAKEAMELFEGDSRKLWQCLLDEVEFPNLEFLYILDAKYNLLSLSNYLMMLKRPPQIQYIQSQFLAFCFSPTHVDSNTRDRGAAVLEHFLHTFLISSYCNPGGSTTLTALKGVVDDILFQLSVKLVTKTNSVSDINNQFVLSVLQEVGLPNSVKKKYFIHQLSQLLTTKSAEPYSLDEVIQFQERFAGSTYRHNNKACLDVMTVMADQPMLPLDVLQIISASIINQNRNWDRILLLITEWLRLVGFEAASMLKDIIKNFLREGVSSQNEELVSLAFILARHGALVSPPAQKIFPRYEVWYSEMFCESHSPAKDLDSFRFLSNILKGWIPFEPSCFLQVQATFWPFIPKVDECRGMWKLYVDLAKVRMTEYIEVEEAMALEPDLSNPVIHDVEMAIKDYEKTRKIPQRVGHILMFNKKYFADQFLPALLKKPTGKVLSDTRLRLIEALNQDGKIPKDLFVAYKRSEK